MMQSSSHDLSVGYRARRTTRPGIAWLAVLALISVVFTAGVVRYSYLHGRLCVDPTYDDCTYLQDAASRVAHLYREGFFGMARQAVTEPPHSPYSTLVCMTGFLIFGMEDWSPYLASGVLIFTMLCWHDRLLTGLARWQKLAMLLFVLTVPLSAGALWEIRPDVACATITGMGVVAIVTRKWLDAPRKHQRLCGAVFGVALLIKPPYFLQTLALFGLSLLLASIVDCLRVRRLMIAKALVSWRVATIPAILIAAPYYLVAGRRLAAYLYTGLFGPLRELWQANGDLAFHARYYLDGIGSVLTIKTHLTVLTIAIVALLLRYMSRGRAWRLRVGAFALVVVMSYASVSISPAKNLVFGSTLATLLLAGVVMGIRDITRAGNRAWKRRAPVAVWALAPVALAAAGLVLFHLPPMWGDRYNGLAPIKREVTQNIMQALDRARLPAGSTVFLTTAGDVTFNMLDYQALRRQANYRVTGNPFDNRVDDYYASVIAGYSAVLTSEPGTLTVYPNLPSTPIQNQLIAMLDARDDFTMIQRVPVTGQAVGYRLYVRGSAFVGFDAVEGLQPAEGPYPQWNLPVVRWGKWPRSVLSIQSTDGRPVSLVLRCRAGMADQMMRVRFEGTEVAAQRLSSVKDFIEVVVPLAVKPGGNIVEIEYDPSPLGTPSVRAVMFREIVVQPAEPAPATRPVH